MKNCECGCGEPARPGKRFAKYHQVGEDGRVLRWIKGLKKYEYRYRIVMEAHLGRPLAPGECVHHKNEVVSDDRIENLEVCPSHSDHMLEHHSGIQGDFSCLTCGNPVRGRMDQRKHFCSRACASGNCGGARPITTGTGLRVTIVCLNCGKTAERKGPGAEAFCSLECYWESMKGRPATPKADSRYLELNGVRKTAPEWARELGVNYKSLMNRVNMGWSDERVLTQPFRRPRSDHMPR